MKRIFTLLLTSCIMTITGFAQNVAPFWSLTGNSNSTTASKFGTTNASNLRFFTNNKQRMTLNASNGYFGIGVLTPTDMLHVNSPVGVNPLRIWINTATKLLVHSNGGTSIGNVTAAPPPNGLSVSGNVGIGTSAPLAKLHLYVSGTNAYQGLAITSTLSGGRTISINQGSAGKLNFTEPGVLDLMTMDFSKGTVGIGTTTPSAKMEILSLSSVSLPPLKTQGIGRGIIATAVAGSYNGSAIGVVGDASGSAGNHYGVYGSASGGSFAAAGYFTGSVYAVSYFNTSDRKFKTDIAPLKNALPQLLTLKPSSYLFKKDSLETNATDGRKQIGLIADEVKAVFPELVNEAVQPEQYNNDGTQIIHPEVKYEAVNYIGLIPVLIASVQEQQKQINEYKERIDKLEATLATLTNTKGNVSYGLTNASLQQNTPNPFHKSSIIRYNIPQGSKGQLNIYDQSGKLLKTLNTSDNMQTEISGQDLTNGTYSYSLVVDGKLISTRQMLIVK